MIYILSQSLLNEVKYSNFDLEALLELLRKNVAIPFKWGQVFQRENSFFKEEENDLCRNPF